jgi:tetratricopeptide (TPR) repeat protein
MKRNFLFIFFSFFILNLSIAEVKDSQGVAYYKAGFPEIAKPILLNEYATDTLTRAETCFFLGNIYFSESKTDSASIYFKKGLKYNEANPLNTIGLAMLKIKSNPKEANADIENVLKIKNNRKNPDYFIAAAYAYLKNGLTDQAMVYQDKARSIKIKYSALAVLTGDIEFAKKDIGLACSNYELAISYDENCKEAYIKYARAYKNVNTALAIDMLNRLKQKEPSFLLVDKELADIYYDNNDFEKASELYDSYLKSGNTNIKDFTRYASSVFYSKDYTKSLEITLLGLQKSPRNPVFNRLAMYNCVALKKYDDAIKYADIFFNKSDHPEFSYYDYTYYGEALRSTKQYDLAIEQYKKALQLDSTQVGFWKDISDMYAEKTDYQNAISSYLIYMKSLSKENQNADVLINLGKLYYNFANATTTPDPLKHSSLINADSLFAQVIALEPASYLGYIWRARTNFALDPESTIGLAKPYYEQTLTNAESKADVRFNPVILECSRYLGYYYFLKKDYTQSKLYWNKILSIDPTNDLAIKAIDGIDRTQKGAKK